MPITHCFLCKELGHDSIENKSQMFALTNMDILHITFLYENKIHLFFSKQHVNGSAVLFYWLNSLSVFTSISCLFLLPLKANANSCVCGFGLSRVLDMGVVMMVCHPQSLNLKKMDQVGDFSHLISPNFIQSQGAYSGGSKYLMPYWFCEFAFFKRNRQSVIRMLASFKKWDIEKSKEIQEIDFKECI